MSVNGTLRQEGNYSIPNAALSNCSLTVHSVSHWVITPNAQRSIAPGSQALPPIAAPPSSPCADIDYLGIIQAVTGDGLMAGRIAYGGRVRNRAPFAKEVEFAWVINGRAEKGTFRIPAGQFISVDLRQGSSPPSNVQVVTCR